MEKLRIEINESLGAVSGLYRTPEEAFALLVLAHGAGAGMDHPFMEALANALYDEGVGTLRFQFPYMEQGSRRPDRPGVAHEAVRAAVREAKERAPLLPLFAGGKSYGGRMASQLAAAGGLGEVKGLVFFGYPLHPAGRPGKVRADHLAEVAQPMLFLQGTRDRLAEVDLIKEVCKKLPKSTLHFLPDGDHSFRTLKRTGITQEQAVKQLAAWTAGWMEEWV
jgi:predicted alpha/beta-hydrolase family hydrolase